MHVQNIFWQPNNVDYNRTICSARCLCSDAITTEAKAMKHLLAIKKCGH
jgi:hypothetical protein